MSPWVSLSSAVLCLAVALGSPSGVAAQDAQQVLRERCSSCHGGFLREAGLRVDSLAELISVAHRDPELLTWGQPEASELYLRTALPENDPDRMPPAGPRLTAGELEALGDWIRKGPPAVAPLPAPAAPPVSLEVPPAWLTARSDPVDFTRDVQPILSRHCYACHGPDEAERAAGLRLDTRAGLLDARAGEPPVVIPGEPSGSLLLQRLLAADPAHRMPPASSAHQPTEAERELLYRWVAEGARFEAHWAFEPISDPAWPRPDGARWASDPLDLFILARAQAAGLSPQPPADRRALIRRLALDLTGLPPTPEEVEAFVRDESPEAYAGLVDRYLASSRFGEHWARPWLDAARYADTHGLHFDNYREIWPYRDWVVHAINTDLPYDQFVTQQVAGDLLPRVGTDPRIATGFLRSHVTTHEGGSIEAEVRMRNVVDRTDTFGSVFLGLTVGCAACHDHKFDPLSQHEYYGLSAFFNNLDGPPMDGNSARPRPFVQVPSAQQTAERRRLERQVAVAEDAIQLELTSLPVPPEPAAPATEAFIDHIWIDDALPDGAKVEGGPLTWLEAPEAQVQRGRFSLHLEAKGYSQRFFRRAHSKLRIGIGDVLFAHVWIDPAALPRTLMLQWNSDGENGWEQRAFWGEDLLGFGRANSPSRRAMGELPQAGQWVRLEVPAAEVGLAPGDVVHGFALGQFDGSVRWDAVGIRSATDQHPQEHVLVEDSLPAGSRAEGDGKTFTFVAKETHAPFSGKRSWRRQAHPGLHQDILFLGEGLRVQRGDRFFVHVWIADEDPAQSVQLQFHAGNWEHRLRWGASAHGAQAKGGANRRAGDLPKRGEWVRLEVSLDQVGLQAGEVVDGIAFTQVGGTVYWDRAGIRSWSGARNARQESFQAWLAGAHRDDKLSADLRRALDQSDLDASSADHWRLRRHWMRHHHPATKQALQTLEARLAKARDGLMALERSIPTTLVWKERSKIRPAHRMDRGAYDQPREVTPRKTPELLPALRARGSTPDRLDLAHWLMREDHPLTLRVQVNRIWQQLFGRGLVLTSEDFGRQGAPPTHPQLLDHLASRYRTEGLSLKALVRRLVLSSTYRQASRAPRGAWKQDPDNRWWARAPRYRLDGEVLRDQALALSGLLHEQLGGPPVKPPQPGGLWKAVGYVGSNTGIFKPDRGPSRVWRRSLYTFWKRTAPPPQFSTFDAPTREACVLRRERTNTPLQALLLLNDPQFLECAHALGARILSLPLDSDHARLSKAFELVTARPAQAEELSPLQDLLDAERDRFRADPASATKLLNVGAAAPGEGDPADRAAWTLVANLLLNLDEVLNRE